MVGNPEDRFTCDMAQMSLIMRKPAFCICENKDAAQLRGNREADQRLCFRYIDSTIPLLPIYEIPSLWPSFGCCTAPFVSDLVRYPEDQFSHNEAQIGTSSVLLIYLAFLISVGSGSNNSGANLTSSHSCNNSYIG